MSAQSHAALALGNEYRQRRVALKREVISGEVKLSEVLAQVELPEWLKGQRIDRMLCWPYRCGEKSANTLLAANRITQTRPVGELTYRQRRALSTAIAKSEKAPRSSGKRAIPRREQGVRGV